MRSALVFICLIITLSSCNKIFEKPRWNTDVKAPVLKTSMSIANIVRDSGVLSADANKFVHIVSRQQLYTAGSLTIDTFAHFTTEPYHKNVKMETLVLDSQTIVHKVTLGQLAAGMDPATRDFIYSSNGSYIPFPGASNITAGPVPIDIQQFFEEADIRTGTMQITLQNNLPVDITNLTFKLTNTSPVDTLTSKTFTNLKSKTSKTDTVNMAGKKVQGTLQLYVTNMSLGSGFVRIDTSDAIIITIKAFGITVNSATAVFPAQDVVNDSAETSLDGLGDIMVTQAKIYKGTVEAVTSSTIGDTIYFTYIIPSATKNGIPFQMNVAVPPGANSNVYTAYFDGYDMNLRGEQNDTVNTFVSHVIGSLKYTGKKVYLSLSDSFDVVVTLKDLKPAYMEGYFGKKVANLGSGSYDLSLFKNIKSGTLNFEQVNVKLTVENEMGLPGYFQINNLTGINTRTAGVVNLSNNITGDIQPAQKTPYQPVTTEVVLNPADAKRLLDILPDRFTYGGSFMYNDNVPVPAANAPTASFPNFVFRDHYINPYLDIEVPLSLLAKDLTLADTVPFLSDNFKTSVNSGTFTVLVDNGFPVSGDLKMYFLDQGGSVIDSATSPGSIAAAHVDASNRVTSKSQSKVSIFADHNRLQNLLRARQIVFKVSFTTLNANTSTYVKIYSDYSIDFKLVADFNYTVD